MRHNFLHAYIDKLFSHAVEGDRNKLSVRLLRLLLRLRPYSYMLYCYRAGQIQNAVNILGSKLPPKNPFLSRVCRRCHEIINVLEEGFEISVPAHQSSKWRFNNRVLLAFHSAESYDPAGYTVRSNAIMRSLDGQNISIFPCTRLGYPWDLLQHKDEIIVDSSHVAGFTIRHFHDPDNLIGDADSIYLEAYANKIANLAQKENVSVIHASSNFLNGLAAAMAGRKLGIKSVYEMRGLWHLTRSVRESGFDQTEHFHYCHKMEVAAANLCDAVVAISDPLKKWLISAGVAPEKIHVIPNAAEVSSGKVSPVTLPSELEHLAGKFVVGFVGSLTDYEGIDLIIRAVAALLPAIPNIHCVIVGDGRERKALESLTSELGINDAVTFAGRVPKSAVPSYYKIIDVFPLPRKSFPVCKLVPPLKPLEIMAGNRPIIVSDLEPLVELVKHKKTGLVCETDSMKSLAGQIRLLQSQPQLAEEIAKNGRQWVLANRTWDQNATLYKDMYTLL